MNHSINHDRLLEVHEARANLREAVERRAATQSKIRTFFANRAVRRAEQAVTIGEARVLEPLELFENPFIEQSV